jgi:hypothetical protein
MQIVIYVFEGMENFGYILCNIRTLEPTRINDNAIPGSVVINKSQLF